MTQLCKRGVPLHSESSCAAESLPVMLAPEFFKAMSDPTRIAILCRVSSACALHTVSQIAEDLPVDLSVVSRHLRILRQAGILKSRKRGKEVFYSVDSRNLVATLRMIADAFEACCPDECPACGEPRLGSS